MRRYKKAQESIRKLMFHISGRLFCLTSEGKKSPSGRLACKEGDELPDVVVI